MLITNRQLRLSLWNYCVLLFFVVVFVYRIVVTGYFPRGEKCWSLSQKKASCAEVALAKVSFLFLCGTYTDVYRAVFFFWFGEFSVHSPAAHKTSGFLPFQAKDRHGGLVVN